MSDPSGPLAAVEQIEQFGDDHLSDGQVEEVVIKYKQAASACAMVLIETSSHEQQAALNDALSRIVEKGRAAWRELPASQRVSIGDVRFGQTMVDRAIADGDLPLAGYLSIEYGRMLLAEGDAERAETAFRQAVTLAREVDADDPELVLLAYVTLLTALGPTEEALSLANELSLAMIGRKELYHPMRAANAVCIRAVLELNYSLTHPAHLNEAIQVCQHAITFADNVCFHDKAQELQRAAAIALREAGRVDEAEHWQALADQYDDWEPFDDQQIPGHVHLWDKRVDTSHLTRPADEW